MKREIGDGNRDRELHAREFRPVLAGHEQRVGTRRRNQGVQAMHRRGCERIMVSKDEFADDFSVRASLRHERTGVADRAAHEGAPGGEPGERPRRRGVRG